MKAIVFFGDTGAGHILDPLLKPGFRHCAVSIEDENGVWILFDAGAGVPRICALVSCDDLAEHYRTHGFTVIETEQKNSPPKGPFLSANCVGMVKAVLAICAPLCVTPYQLYKYLRRTSC